MHYGKAYQDASYMPSFLGISLFLNTQKQKVGKKRKEKEKQVVVDNY